MKQILIIPDKQEIENSVALAKNYGAGFEYNDFVQSDVLDDEGSLQQIISAYKTTDLPEYCTLHGAFFDVLPFSVDQRIRQIADLRIRQSVQSAKQMGAKAVVFHTNYNPFLNSKDYLDNWIATNAVYWSNVLEQNQEINIYLENMFDLTPDVLKQLSERLCQYKNFGVCLDYAHAFLSKTAPAEWAKCLGQFVKHVHINDNDGISDLHLAWGDGIIHKEEFYNSYKEYLSGASVVIETSGYENKVKSLQRLEQDGFFD